VGFGHLCDIENHVCPYPHQVCLLNQFCESTSPLPETSSWFKAGADHQAWQTRYGNNSRKVIKYHGMSFPWKSRVPGSTRRERQKEMKDKMTGSGRECVSKIMSIASGRNRRDNLAS
jgi:hypothetical protein